MAGFGNFQLRQPDGYILDQAPQLQYGTGYGAQPANLGNYGQQLSMTNISAPPPEAASNAGTYASAGINAAGQAAATIANIMAQTQARNAAIQQADLGRGHTLQIAKLQMAAQKALAEKAREQAAQQNLLRSLSQNASDVLKRYDTETMPQRALGSLLSQIYL